MKKVDPEDVGKSIFYMICGRMIPKQKDIMRRRAKVYTKMYMDILSWFIQKSGHSAFKDLQVPDTVPAPGVIEDSSSINNTDCEVNPSVENRVSGGIHSTSQVQENQQQTHLLVGLNDGFLGNDKFKFINVSIFGCTICVWHRKVVTNTNELQQQKR